jgi:hypothetical protein
MAVTPKPDVNTVWASSGISIDPTPGKIETGWVVEKPPYQWENFMRNRDGNFIKHVNQRGVAEWDSTTEYEIGSLSIASDNNLYQSKTASNVGNDPVGSPINWGIAAFADVFQTPQDNIIIGGEFGTNPWQRSPTPGPKTVVWPNPGSEGITNTGSDRFGTFQNSSSPISGVVTQEKWINTPSVIESGVYSNASLKYEVSTAQPAINPDDQLSIIYIIEGFDFQKIAQIPFTISFWVYASVAGQYAISLDNEIPTDRILSSPYTVNNANTWQKIELFIPASPSAGNWNYSNSRGLSINFTLIAGSNSVGANFNTWETDDNLPVGHVNFLSVIGNIFAIDLVKVEPGSVATGWKSREYGDTLSLCQRYYEKTYEIDVVPGTPGFENSSISGNANNIGTAAGSWRETWQMKSTKRLATPDVTIYSPDSGAQGKIYGTGDNTDFDSEFSSGKNSVVIRNMQFPILANSEYIAHAVSDAEFKN